MFVFEYRSEEIYRLSSQNQVNSTCGVFDLCDQTEGGSAPNKLSTNSLNHLKHASPQSWKHGCCIRRSTRTEERNESRMFSDQSLINFLSLWNVHTLEIITMFSGNLLLSVTNLQIMSSEKEDVATQTLFPPSLYIECQMDVAESHLTVIPQGSSVTFQVHKLAAVISFHFFLASHELFSATDWIYASEITKWC